MVCKLLKALYGLKQSPCFWYKRLANFFFKKLGLKRINVNHSTFVIMGGLDGPVVNTFVNNIKIMAPKDNKMIKQIKLELILAFSMIDMGPISFYLGLKVQRDWKNQTVKLSQPTYINKVHNKFYLDKTYVGNTPMKKTALLKHRTEEKVSKSEKKRYQGMMKSLIFSIVETRPDIAFTISIASCFAKNLGYQHTKAIKTILQYLKGLNKQGITYSGQSKLLVEGYFDFDWARAKKSRKSTSDFIFMLNGDPISWCSRRQLTVVFSSTKTKYIALTLAAKQAT